MRGLRARPFWSVPAESRSSRGGLVALRKVWIVSSCLVVYVITGHKGRNLLVKKQHQHTSNTHLTVVPSGWSTIFMPMKMDFHPMEIGFPRIYSGEPSWTYFGELSKKRAFYRGIWDSPRSKRQISLNFEIILPKFHFILPKFHFAPPWRIFIFHGAIGEFLRGDWHW